MSLFNFKNDITLVVYVLSTHQLLESSLIILLLKKELNIQVKTVLIYHNSVEQITAYYNMSMWDEVIEVSGNSWFSPLKMKHLLNIRKWYKSNKEAIAQLESIKSIKIANIFIYSNGDTIFVNKFINEHPEAIIINVSDGTNSYMDSFGSHSTKSDSCLKVIINELRYRLLSIIFSCKITPDMMTPISGNVSTNFYWDFNIDIVNEAYSQKRILIGKPLHDLKEYFKDVFNYKNVNIPPMKRKCVVFLSNLFSDGAWKLCTESDEIKFDIKYLNPFIDRGYQVFIKPHPKENLAKLKKLGCNVDILSTLRDAPFELLINEKKFDYIVSVGSNAMVNAINLQMADNYIILDKVFCTEVPTSREYVNFTDYANLTNENNVYFPDNIEELTQLIEKNERIYKGV